MILTARSNAFNGWEILQHLTDDIIQCLQTVWVRVDQFSTLPVFHCLKSQLQKYIVRFGAQKLAVVSWESADGKQRLSGTLGGDDVSVVLALPAACQFVSGLSFSCTHPPWQSKHHSTNVTAGHWPVMCVCLSNEGVFVPKLPASLLIEFSLPLMCLSVAFFQIQLTLSHSSFREEPKHPYPSPLLHPPLFRLSVLLRYWEML